MSSLFSDSNGPLTIILSYVDLFYLTTHCALVSRAFYNASLIAMLRPGCGYSKAEYEDMFVRRGIGEMLLLRILQNSDSFEPRYTIRLKVFSGAHGMAFDVRFYCLFNRFVRCLEFLCNDVGEFGRDTRSDFFAPSAYFLCIRNGEIKLMKLLLSLNAKRGSFMVFRTDTAFRGALIKECCRVGRPRFLRLFLRRWYGIRVNLDRLRFLDTVLCEWLEGFSDSLEDESPEENLTIDKELVTTCLHVCCAHNQSRSLALLMACDEFQIEMVSVGSFLLRIAAMRGFDATVRLLLSGKIADLSEDGWVSLRKACAYGHSRCVEAILSTLSISSCPFVVVEDCAQGVITNGNFPEVLEVLSSWITRNIQKSKDIVVSKWVRLSEEIKTVPLADEAVLSERLKRRDRLRSLLYLPPSSILQMLQSLRVQKSSSSSETERPSDHFDRVAGELGRIVDEAHAGPTLNCLPLPLPRNSPRSLHLDSDAEIATRDRIDFGLNIGRPYWLEALHGVDTTQSECEPLVKEG